MFTKIVATIDKNKVWNSIVTSAAIEVHNSPLAAIRYNSIIDHDSFESALAFIIATALQSNEFPANILLPIIKEVLDHPIIDSAVRDLAKIVAGDPAAKSEGGEPNYLIPFSWFQGFHALEAYRVAHRYYELGQHHTAYALQHIMYKAFAADIHPAARIGSGGQFDHLVGLVIGETASIGDDFYILHQVTLGGTGKETGDRHPKVGRSVTIGAGVKVLGNIAIGDHAALGANSTVTKPVPAHHTARGQRAHNYDTGAGI